MTETITARLPEKLVRTVDAAVRKGAFQSRSEAVRTILEEYLKEHPELFLAAELDIVLGDEMSDKELEKLGAKLFAGGKVARLVGEDRHR